MTDPSPGEATRGTRRRADLMVALFVTAIVAVLGGVAVLLTGGGTAMGIALVVIAVVAFVAGVVLLRSISPEDRERLTAPKDGDGNG